MSIFFELDKAVLKSCLQRIQLFQENLKIPSNDGMISGGKINLHTQTKKNKDEEGGTKNADEATSNLTLGTSSPNQRRTKIQSSFKNNTFSDHTLQASKKHAGMHEEFKVEGIVNNNDNDQHANKNKRSK